MNPKHQSLVDQQRLEPSSNLISLQNNLTLPKVMSSYNALLIPNFLPVFSHSMQLLYGFRETEKHNSAYKTQYID